MSSGAVHITWQNFPHPCPASKTLHRKNVHTYQSRSWSDLIWFGGSLYKFPGPTHLLSSISLTTRSLLVTNVIKPASNYIFSDMRALEKHGFVKMSSSTLSRIVFQIMSLTQDSDPYMWRYIEYTQNPVLWDCTPYVSRVSANMYVTGARCTRHINWDSDTSIAVFILEIILDQCFVKTCGNKKDSFKGQCREIFISGFFVKQHFRPDPSKHAWKLFRIFGIFLELFYSESTPHWWIHRGVKYNPLD